jgi:uncharacterized protein (TIGR02265 family)
MGNPEVWKDRFVFPSLIEGYIKGVGDRFTDETRRKLKAAGLDVTKMPPAIPALEMVPYMEIVASTAWPDEPRIEQLRLLGLAAIRGWKTGLLGSATAAMIRLIGPQRALTRLDRAFSTTNNFNRAKTELIGAKEALVTVNDVQNMPSYWQGIFEAGVEILGLEGTVVLDHQTPPEATFRITWK